jgi:Ca2+-binding EF-hand superfamily protein
VLRRQLSDYYHYLDLKDSFQRFDKDSDGKLSKQDMIPWLGTRLPPKIIDQAIVASDTDRDGYISWSEYPLFASELERLYHH